MGTRRAAARLRHGRDGRRRHPHPRPPQPRGRAGHRGPLRRLRAGILDQRHARALRQRPDRRRADRRRPGRRRSSGARLGDPAPGTPERPPGPAPARAPARLRPAAAEGPRGAQDRPPLPPLVHLGRRQRRARPVHRQRPQERRRRDARRASGSGSRTDRSGPTPRSASGATTRRSDHSHWHLFDFQRYELRRADGSVVVRDRKSGFCIGDRYGVAPGRIAGRTFRPVFRGFCNLYQPGAARSTPGRPSASPTATTPASTARTST